MKMWNRKLLYYFVFIRSLRFLQDFSAFIYVFEKNKKTENSNLLRKHKITTEFRNRIT